MKTRQKDVEVVEESGLVGVLCRQCNKQVNTAHCTEEEKAAVIASIEFENNNFSMLCPACVLTKGP